MSSEEALSELLVAVAAARQEYKHARDHEDPEVLAAWRAEHVYKETPSYGQDVMISVLEQRPNATRIAGKRAWASRGRRLREGAQPIQVGAGKREYAPFVHPRTGQVIESPSLARMMGLRREIVGYARVQDVYDVADTEAIDPPRRTPQEIAGAQRLVEHLRRLAAEDGVALYLGGVQDPQTVQEKAVNVHLLGERAAGGVHAQFADRKTFIATPGLDDPVEQAMVLAHEYGHAAMGHLTNVSVLGAAGATKREVQAESYAYVLGRHFGIDWKPSAVYLQSWAQDVEWNLSSRVTDPVLTQVQDTLDR